jgi:HD-GYP domain-containing protein (c-di-GMP phosphodiesterase class II)
LRGTGSRWKDQVWAGDAHLRVGRVPGIEMYLEDDSVSRRHAEVLYTEEGWVVRDLGSTNGTLVNGLRVGRVGRKLNPLDMLQFGNVVVVAAEMAAADEGGDSPSSVLQVCATAQQPFDEALELLAVEATGLADPGDQLRSLIDSHQLVARAGSLEEAIRKSLRDAVIKVRAEYGAVVLADEGTSRMTLAASYAVRGGAEKARPFHRTLAQRCYTRGESLLGKEEFTQPSPARGGPPSQSLICALIRTPNRRLGVLHLERTAPQKDFLPHDLRLADALAAGMSSVIESGRGTQKKQRDVFLQTVIALAQAVELRDPYTGGHAQRVTDYSLLLAEQLHLTAAECDNLRLGGPLHDVGKIGIDDAILRKNGPLTAEEFEIMKEHTVKGVAILQPIPEVACILPIVRSHHERWDGKGYPDGLAGDRIPFLARLLAVGDTFDAMTTDRPYRRGLTLGEALAEIERGAGTQFDPECALAFVLLGPRLEEIMQQRSLIDTWNHRKVAASIPSGASAGRG